jgi:hypothetical protein
MYLWQTGWFAIKIYVHVLRGGGASSLMRHLGPWKRVVGIPPANLMTLYQYRYLPVLWDTKAKGRFS